MSRPRGDPARIRAAQREGPRKRLIGTGLSIDRVDQLLAAFDQLPDRLGLQWDGEAAYRWALAQPRR